MLNLLIINLNELLGSILTVLQEYVEDFIVDALDYVDSTIVGNTDIHNVFFTILGVLSIFSALMVIFSQNPVHSILFLILTFFNFALIMILLGAEFIGLLFLIVYIGAVAVLLLFVVMMLNVREVRTKFAKRDIVLIFGLIAFFVFELMLMYGGAFEAVDRLSGPGGTLHGVYSNILYLLETRIYGGVYIVGMLLFTQKYLHFLVIGFILLISMFGVIILTVGKHNLKKSQDDFVQVNRDHKAVVMREISFAEEEDVTGKKAEEPVAPSEDASSVNTSENADAKK
jgi:NADH-quinone oxidoreductase subunit J